MDNSLEANELLGKLLVQQARISSKYWHSGASTRGIMRQPMFDKNTSKRILDMYKEFGGNGDIAA
jgi:hypothetical protein